MSGSRLLQNPALLVVLTVPLLSIMLGAVMLYFAYSASPTHRAVPAQDPLSLPLSKTSWRGHTDVTADATSPVAGSTVEGSMRTPSELDGATEQ